MIRYGSGGKGYSRRRKSDVMTRNTIVAIMVAPLILAFCTAAYTEQKACAWLLWTQEREVPRGKHEKFPWDIVQAFEALTECRKHLKRAVEKSHRGVWDEEFISRRIEKNSGSVSVIPSGPRIFALFRDFHCLPDTVDPRSPKQ